MSSKWNFQWSILARSILLIKKNMSRLLLRENVIWYLIQFQMECNCQKEWAHSIQWEETSENFLCQDTLVVLLPSTGLSSRNIPNLKTTWDLLYKSLKFLKGVAGPAGCGFAMSQETKNLMCQEDPTIKRSLEFGLKFWNSLPITSYSKGLMITLSLQKTHHVK